MDCTGRLVYYCWFGTTSITVTAGLTGQNGTITVLAANSCGNSSVQSLAVVVSSPAPATPGTISRPTPVCPNTAGLVYSVSPVANATSYNWSLPAGWVITSGAGTNTITVTSGTVAGNVSVSASNSCGTSGVQAKALALNPRFLPLPYLSADLLLFARQLPVMCIVFLPCLMHNIYMEFTGRMGYYLWCRFHFHHRYCRCCRPKRQHQCYGG